ncbi:Replication protein A 70 kDa DNA-binding subunit B [Sarracenia purpurea var. burkii]
MQAVKKFYEKFQLGKVYFISKGTLKLTNKQFKSVQNDYEMTLNENSEVEEASNEATFITATKFNFVLIDHLGPYVNSRELVAIIGVVQNVSPTYNEHSKKNSQRDYSKT